MISTSNLFQLSKKVDYGLYFMTELAKNFELEVGSIYEPISLHTVAKEHQMSFFFLQKVAHDLKNAGLITASRGKMGGYVLARDPHEINLKEILEALEGPVTLMHCLIAGGAKFASHQCAREGRCQMKNGLQFINQLLLKTLQSTTLHHLLHNSWPAQK